MDDILKIEDLVVRFYMEDNTVNALNHIDLTLKEGENVIPVKVTAGNQRDTKTYTLTIIKEST